MGTPHTRLSLRRRRTLNIQKDNLLKMIRAMYRTQKWLYTHDNNEIAAVVSPYFPDISLRIICLEQ